MDDVSILDDQTLVQRIISGETELYELLMQRYEHKLLRYVVYLIHDLDIATDAVQDTFIKAYVNLRSYKSKYSFSSWIFRIAHNEAMNAIKRQKKIVNVDDQSSTEIFVEPSTVEESIDKTILQRDVQNCMARLQPKYSEVLAFHYFEHMSYQEISHILHIPTSTVGVRLARARSALKDICERNGVHYA